MFIGGKGFFIANHFKLNLKLTIQDLTAAILLSIANILGTTLWSHLAPPSSSTWGPTTTLKLGNGRSISLTDRAGPGNSIHFLIYVKYNIFSFMTCYSTITGLVIGLMTSYDPCYAALATASFGLWVASNISQKWGPMVAGTATAATTVPILLAALYLGDTNKMFKFQRNLFQSSTGLDVTEHFHCSYHSLKKKKTKKKRKPWNKEKKSCLQGTEYDFYFQIFL